MKLPNGDQAIVDLVKLTEYCLSRTHPRGRHKARVFEAVLGFTVDHAEVLRAALLEAAKTEETMVGETDEFGQRYSVDSTVEGPNGEGIVRSAWIIRSGDDVPRLTSCYLL